MSDYLRSWEGGGWEREREVYVMKKNISLLCHILGINFGQLSKALLVTDITAVHHWCSMLTILVLQFLFLSSA